MFGNQVRIIKNESTVIFQCELENFLNIKGIKIVTIQYSTVLKDDKIIYSALVVYTHV